MCIAFMYISDNPEQDGYKVIIASNRDEFYDRPTMEINWWKDRPDIISGLDMFPGKEGGTWLGMTKAGKIGILTNYRQSEEFTNPNDKSRGHLVSDFLKSDENPKQYLENVMKHGHEYSGFNLIVGDLSQGMDFSYYCNKEHQPFLDLKPGIYGLSNRYMDFGWKKVVLGKERFEKIVKGDEPVDEAKLMELLGDETRYGLDDNFRGPEDEGIPDEFLEPLTAISVNVPIGRYGTRSSCIISVDSKNNVTLLEKTLHCQSFNPKDHKWALKTFSFKIEPKSQL